MNASRRGRLESPIGTVEVTVNDAAAVLSVSFVDQPVSGTETDEACSRALRQLEEYFRGERRRFELALEPEGTEFELKVWNQVRRIPYGATDTYGEIARRMGADPGSARAVGLANARNPIAIIVPCHRVIGSDGDLTGYAGGLDRKKWLLDMESGQARLF
jgi:methylated-DNA-[protein]-cysteine S-methyltransferase